MTAWVRDRSAEADRIGPISGRPLDRDFYGESVGFFKFSPRCAKRLMQTVEAFVTSDRRDRLYEEAIRQLILSDQSIAFGFEDISGLPWTEIDFYSVTCTKINKLFKTGKTGQLLITSLRKI